MPTGELQGCPFQNRCAVLHGKMSKEKPELKTLDENHQIACWRIEDYPHPQISSIIELIKIEKSEKQ